MFAINKLSGVLEFTYPPLYLRDPIKVRAPASTGLVLLVKLPLESNVSMYQLDSHQNWDILTLKLFISLRILIF